MSEFRDRELWSRNKAEINETLPPKGQGVIKTHAL